MTITKLCSAEIRAESYPEREASRIIAAVHTITIQKQETADEFKA